MAGEGICRTKLNKYFATFHPGAVVPVAVKFHMNDDGCAPGFIVYSKNLLDKNPKSKEDDCKQALADNICCGTYPRHSTAIMEASSQIFKGV